MTSRLPELAIIDTSVYLDNVRSGRFEEDLLALPYLVRASANSSPWPPPRRRGSARDMWFEPSPIAIG